MHFDNLRPLVVGTPPPYPFAVINLNFSTFSTQKTLSLVKFLQILGLQIRGYPPSDSVKKRFETLPYCQQIIFFEWFTSARKLL